MEDKFELEILRHIVCASEQIKSETHIAHIADDFA